jgi:hypothetical protein
MATFQMGKYRGRTCLNNLTPNRMTPKETAMIELNEEQRRELQQPEPVAVNPETQETYVLVRKAVYDRMKELLYDDSPWTDEEMELLAWEAGKTAGWEEMDEYDHYPEKK